MGAGKTERTGGTIERGIVKAVTDGGYTLASYDREGIETPPLKAIDSKTYSVGEQVYFFYFNDGTGKVICGF